MGAKHSQVGIEKYKVDKDDLPTGNCTPTNYTTRSSMEDVFAHKTKRRKFFDFKWSKDEHSYNKRFKRQTSIVMRATATAMFRFRSNNMSSGLDTEKSIAMSNLHGNREFHNINNEQSEKNSMRKFLVSKLLGMLNFISLYLSHKLTPHFCSKTTSRNITRIQSQ